MKESVKKSSKKAQQNILVGVLLIALVIVAVLILYNISMPLIKEAKGDIESSQKELALSSLEVKDWEETSPNVIFTEIQAGAGESIGRLSFLITTDDGQTCIIEKDVYIQAFETKNVEFSLDECDNEIVSSDIADISAVAVDAGGSGGGGNGTIACYQDSDCGGRREYIGDPYCAGINVYRDYNVYKCIKPGTLSSYCNVTKTSGIIMSCEKEDQVCLNGECIPISHENWCNLADINRDGIVDAADSIIITKLKNCIANESNNWCSNADVNRDGIVNQADSDILTANFGRKCPQIIPQARSLASGADLVYLQNPLNKNVYLIENTDLPTVLENGTFVDDNGNEYIYNQTIILGSSNKNALRFSNSELDLVSPNVIITLSDNPEEPIYSLNIDFSK